MNRAADFLPDVLADAFRGVKGFQIEVYPGAEHRGRTTDFHPADPQHGGVCNHHTGRGSFDALLAYMAENSRIAPLTNWSTSRPWDGIVRVVVVATGRANHAGLGGAGREGTPWVPTHHGNTYLVRSTGADDTDISALHRIDPDAEGSSARVGFDVVATHDEPGLSSAAQAREVARALARRDAQRGVRFSSPPDPRHDTYGIVELDGTRYVEVEWNLPLQPGADMTHVLAPGVQ